MAQEDGDFVTTPDRNGTTLPGPEQLIVATIRDDIADTRTVHQLSASREIGSFDTTRIEWLEEKIARENGFAPLSWPAVCGATGFVYVKAGPFERSASCAVCRRVSRAASKAGKRLAA